jgi:hypothetical protein
MSKSNMSNAATQAKKRWNAKNYTVIKVSATPDVAAAFKAACAVSGVSMNGKLTEFMFEYSGIKTKSRMMPDYSTRRKRRTAVKLLTEQMEQIRDAEEQCRDNIPENLQGSVVYDNADEYVSMLDEAVELLGSIY